MMVACITPVADANLLKGPIVPRDTALMGPRSSVSDTRCEFRTGQSLQLTPLSTASAAYALNVADLGVSNMPGLKPGERPRSCVRITLQLPEGMSLAKLDIDSVRFYLGGQTEVAMQLHEMILSNALAVLAGPPGKAGDGVRQMLPPSNITPVGYRDDEAMLPSTLRGLSGVRLLQEYFAFPERFLFIDINGLKPIISGITGRSFEIAIVFSRPGQGLDGAVSADNFCLNCVPAVNLFPKRADRIAVDEGHHEFHVVPDRTAPLDFEVYDVLAINGFDDQGGERRFLPLYAPDHTSSMAQPAYYTIWREPRLMSESARREGPRSGYIGSEVFVSLVDPNDAPYSETLSQLSLQTRCTNRDLPVFMPASASHGDYRFEAGVPLVNVKAVAGPSRPHTALREGGVAWRLLNLLSLNYLSLLDTDGGTAVAAMRDLLSRFPQGKEPAVQRQIEALQDVSAQAVVRRHPVKGPIAFSRGVEVRLTVDELGHAGGSAFLFGAAMHQYLLRHASMNSFVETVLVSLTRGEVARWKPARGTRPVI
jgi:type VI secretion system protein ImpG